MTPEQKQKLAAWAEHFLEIYEVCLEVCAKKFPIEEAKHLALEYAKADIQSALLAAVSQRHE